MNGNSMENMQFNEKCTIQCLFNRVQKKGKMKVRHDLERNEGQINSIILHV